MCHLKHRADAFGPRVCFSSKKDIKSCCAIILEGEKKAPDLGRSEPSSTALLTGFSVPGNCGWWREREVRRKGPSSVPLLFNFSTFYLPTNNSNTKSRVKTIVFEASPNNSRFDGGLLLIEEERAEGFL